MSNELSEFTQLDEDEIEAELIRRAEQRELDKIAARELAKKQRSFRFVGGML